MKKQTFISTILVTSVMLIVAIVSLFIYPQKLPYNGTRMA